MLSPGNDFTDSVVNKINKCLGIFRSPSAYLEYLRNILTDEPEPAPEQEVKPSDFDYPRDEFGKEDIEYDPNNDKSDSDDSNDWLPSLSNKPRDEFELHTIGHRTITQLRQTAHRLN